MLAFGWQISGKKAVRAFIRLGYKVVRQAGSHIIFRHEDRPTLTIQNKWSILWDCYTQK
ncbi:MAG: hypothetical protein B6245_23050 [Desulfobacteraceae bacterium 4572_88]|nr:MAG: hypothetical protein B6245_23050 [Desulfobacteraceae bacterium 4572_88]